MPVKKTPPVDDVSPFQQPGQTAPAPVDIQALVARLTQLQKDVAAADRERATAEAQLAQAQKDLAEIDAHLKEMNVDPATAEAALTTLEQNLDALSKQVAAQIAAERVAYQKIAAAVQ